MSADPVPAYHSWTPVQCGEWLAQFDNGKRCDDDLDIFRWLIMRFGGPPPPHLMARWIFHNPKEASEMGYSLGPDGAIIKKQGSC